MPKSKSKGPFLEIGNCKAEGRRETDLLPQLLEMFGDEHTSLR